MAETDNEDRSEQPTAKRKRDAREKGQVPRSRDLTTTAVMLAGAAGLMLSGPHMADGFTALFHHAFHLGRKQVFDPQAPIRFLTGAFEHGLLIIAPFVLLLLVVALLAPALIGGWSFSVDAFLPKLEKLDPLKGIKRIFGVHGLVELIKSVVKVLVVGGVGVFLLWHWEVDFRRLAGEPLGVALVHAANLFFLAFFYLAGSLVLIAAVDVPFQLWEFNKNLRMTKQEVRDEFKETEGKPEVKGRIRQLQRRMAQGRMMENVPHADVVVTNPTHFAVALKYDQLRMRAPVVVAMGTDLVARRIREVAQENKVPLFEAPPLARALYHTSDLEREIPAGLYLAVAQVLAYIYQMRKSRKSGQGAPKRPNPEIPDEFLEYANRGRRRR